MTLVTAMGVRAWACGCVVVCGGVSGMGGGGVDKGGRDGGKRRRGKKRRDENEDAEEL